MASLPRALLLALPLSALLASLAACGSDVIAPGDSGSTSGSTGGSGGSPSTTNASSTASSSATSGSTASSSSGTSAGGSGGAFCGGEAGIPCSVGELCDFPDDSCGGDDSSGVCAPLPGDCPPDCPGVCGCDGMFYCSECAAHAAGVDVSAVASCVQPDGEYSAFLWLGGLDHLSVRKADPVRNVCLAIFLDAPMMDAQGFDFTAPQRYGVSHAYITDDAADCASDVPQPGGMAFYASGGQGTLAWTVAPGMYYPCELDVDASITFAPGPAWVNAVEVMSATGVIVEGGCL